VQRLHAAVEHLGEARVVGHLGDGQARVGEQLGRAAGGEQLHAERVQLAREFEDSGLVGHGDECGQRAHLINLCSTSLRRSVLRLMPSHSAARLWLPSACFMTTSSSGFSTTFMIMSYIDVGSTPRRSLK